MACIRCIRSYSLEELQRRFGESTGVYLYNICRGIDHEEVTASKPPQSLMAAKSFTTPITRREEMQKWFSILAAELHRRIMDHFEEFAIWPRNITIKYATVNNRTYRSKSLGSLHRNELKTPDSLAKRFANTFHSLEDAYPCVGLDLCATGLVPDESATSYTINRFFTKSTDLLADSKPKPSAPREPNNNNNNNPLKKSISPERKGLDLFFAKKEPSASDDDDDHHHHHRQVQSNQKQVEKEEEDETTFMCDKCQKRISIDSVQEHSDYHFALEIMEQERQNSSLVSSTANHSHSQKRSNSHHREEDTEQKKKKRALFFKPRSSSSS
ncbi:hypothetical protein BDF20DRAFT_498707 [Mycotypha africana]|uniref:uncharacterized protein n=1 Tax=Mycotypha africana TaxID=64632 RepID=UPI0023014085|nr:uncharacterized protein BDF20DRAFT_498707 [Mycotypha africana]KAI8979353.1 hypothetical protein BDF20DRAFT_498707 [Mycotypha africana]